jgi:hypothetical protein
VKLNPGLTQQDNHFIIFEASVVFEAAWALIQIVPSLKPYNHKLLEPFELVQIHDKLFYQVPLHKNYVVKLITINQKVLGSNPPLLTF